MRSSRASAPARLASILSSISVEIGSVSRSVQSFLRPMSLFHTYDIDDGLDISYVRNIGKRRDQVRKTQTVEDVKETFSKIKKADAKAAMARAMLKYGNLNNEAREYVEQEYPQ